MLDRNQILSTVDELALKYEERIANLGTDPIDYDLGRMNVYKSVILDLEEMLIEANKEQ